jgi:hypothetical protein
VSTNENSEGTNDSTFATSSENENAHGRAAKCPAFALEAVPVSFRAVTDDASPRHRPYKSNVRLVNRDGSGGIH